MKSEANLSLPKNPTVSDFQKYVDDMCQQRGFDKETLQEIFVLFVEEAGEFARIVRKLSGTKTDVAADGRLRDAGDELADLFIYLLHLANKLDINLEEAFRVKEEKNKQRSWK
ncbi:hypothetical protein BH23PAT1_BH23PAT1_1410 [soil metagenome]